MNGKHSPVGMGNIYQKEWETSSNVMVNISQCAWEIFSSTDGKLYAVGLDNMAKWEVDRKSKL